MGNSRYLKGLGLAALAALIVVPSVWAQTTQGSITGVAVDQAGAPLPGVTVTASSDALIAGSKTTVTGADGQFRLVSLAPGTYTVEFSLDGYQTVRQERVEINIGARQQVEATLTSEFAEELLVTSETPIVNTTSTTLGNDFNEEFFRNMPTGRSYESIASVTPGAQSDAVGRTFYGSTGAENSYYINGVNTTGVEFGTRGKELNFEFIEEVQVKTGGYQAEHGRSTGGIINVITKSGGNEFHGDVFGYFDDDGLQADLEDEPFEGAQQGTFREPSFTESDYGVDLGGYLVQDKLWFFAAYNRIDNETTREVLEDFCDVQPGAPCAGDQFTITDEGDFYAGKLTWLINPRHTVVASAFGDPADRTGPIAGGLSSPPTGFLGTEETGATDGALNYDGVLTDNFIVTAKYTTHSEEETLTGPGADLAIFQDHTDPLGDGTVLIGFPEAPTAPGFGFYEGFDFGRDSYGADGTVFVENFGGDHEFKAGISYEEVDVNKLNFTSGGSRVRKFSCADLGFAPGTCPQGVVYEHEGFLPNEGFDLNNLQAGDLVSPFVVSTDAEDQSYFIQDTWRPLSNLTLNLGARWDHQTLFDGRGREHYTFDATDEIAPRLGFVWDPLEDGRSKVFGNFGHFYEIIPMDMVIRSFGGEVTFLSYNFSPSPEQIANIPAVGNPLGARILGAGAPSPVAPDTTMQYIEEIVIGGEYEVLPNLAVGLKYINRSLESVVEDSLADANFAYFIGNPGEAPLNTTIDMSCLFLGGSCGEHPLATPTREFEGVELTVRKRPTRNFQYFGSVLYSENTGNYDGLFQDSTGQLDPNLNSAFDFFEFQINNDGFLSNDREWQLKWDGLYTFDFGLTAGVSTRYITGLPITAFGYSQVYRNFEYYLSERGDFGRTDDVYEADIHLGYPFQFANGMELNLLLDVFNLLDRQGELSVDDEYTNTVQPFQQPFYDPINYTTGEIFTLDGDNPQVPPLNSGFKTSDDWQQPREIRLGVRLSW